jgi:hypothetical protein
MTARRLAQTCSLLPSAISARAEWGRHASKKKSFVLLRWDVDKSPDGRRGIGTGTL